MGLIFLLILSLSLVTTVQGQGDDGGSMDQDQQDNAPELSDPNSVAPPNKQGYGVNVKTGLSSKAATKPMKIDNTLPTPIGEQSILAIQQFAVLVGVALMVGILFMLNIGLDLLMDWVSEKVTDLFCKKRVQDPENPAALVGTFKRYK